MLLTTYGSACASSAPPAPFPFRRTSAAHAVKATASAVRPVVSTAMGPDGRPMIKAALALPVHEGTSLPGAWLASRRRALGAPIDLLDTTQPFQINTVNAVGGVDLPGPLGPRSGSPPV